MLIIGNTMVLSFMLKVMSLALMITLCRGQGQDATLTPGSFGTDIVNSVVSKIRANCIFSEDRLFLRRTAYVMSRDGSDSFTYRPGYHGGIWQISEAMFLATKDCTHSSISAACSNITAKLSISWPSVQWPHLRRPLYSGLAAALHTLINLGQAEMPGNVSSQANIWAQMYGENNSTFVTDVARVPGFECKDKLDLVFILDSSGSVSEKSFDLMRQFAASVVDAMNVSLDAIRIADIVYGSNVLVHFDFDDHTTKSSVNTSLMATTKLGGGTNTAAALDQARAILNHHAGRGARENVKKVAVLVTDGRSNSFTRTKNSAEHLKKAGATVFAVGVGNYRPDELKVVASDPVCSHVLTLTGFDKIQSIVTEIQKSTCEASYRLVENSAIQGNLTENTTEITTVTEAPAVNKTIEAQVSCGILNIYVSTTDPKPGPIVFDDLYLATPEAPAVLRVVETLPHGTSVYITVVGTRLPPSVAALLNCSDYSWSLGVTEKKVIEVICKENGVERDCTEEDVSDAGFCPNNVDLSYGLENPCTQENLDNGIMRHSYLYNPRMFLQCDMQGHSYLTLCHGGLIFNVVTRECGFTSPGSGSETQGHSSQAQNQTSQGHVTAPTVATVTVTPTQTQTQTPTTTPATGISSVCTSQAISNNLFYHTYGPNNTKFIQCDVWGVGHLMPCVTGTVWSQIAYTCVHASLASRSLTGTAPTTNPTTTATPAPTTTTAAATTTCTLGKFYPNVCNPQQYYQCVHGTKVPMPCPSGLYFSETLNVCTNTPVTVPAHCSG